MKSSKIKELIFLLILIIYIMFMCKILLFKNVPITEVFDTSRNISRERYNLIPFFTIHLYFFSGYISNIFISILNVLGNVLIFTPLAIYLQIYKKDKSFKKTISTVFFITLCVEVVQFIFGLGIFDVDDIILNVFGGVVGVFIYRFLRFIFKDDEKIKNIIIVLVFTTFIIYFALMVYAKSKGLMIRLF